MPVNLFSKIFSSILLISEQFNKYVFKVNKSANKLEIKKSIEERFNVKILKVSTMNFKGKTKENTRAYSYIDWRYGPEPNLCSHERKSC